MMGKTYTRITAIYVGRDGSNWDVGLNLVLGFAGSQCVPPPHSPILQTGLKYMIQGVHFILGTIIISFQ